MIQKIKLLRITTSSISMDILLRGQLAFLNQYFEVVCVSSGVERLRIIKEREGVRIYNLKMVRSINLALDLISLIKLLFLFIREKPDLVHSNTPKASFLSMMAAWCLRIPIRIYTVTGLRFETEMGLKRSLLKNIERLTCYFSTTVIPEGKGVKNTLYNEKITKKTLKVINNGNINGIDLNYFNPEGFLKISNQLERFKKILKIEKKEFVFCFVGRLVRDKGIRELIYAFLGLNKMNFQNPNINHKPVLIIIGPMGYGKDRLDKETEQIIYSSPSIKYVGRQDDIRPYLMISDVFVFPSYREGFPNVVMQAGAMGLASMHCYRY